MNFEHIQVLDAVVTTGGFRAASEHLNKVQSAVSYSIRKLEEELGFEIFDRELYRPQLTPKGLAYYERAKRILTQARQLKEYSQQLSAGVEPKISISVSSIYPLFKLKEVLVKMKSQFPITELEITTETLSGIELIENSIVDLVISSGEFDKHELEYRPLDEIEFPMLIASNHILACLETVKREQLLEYPQIVNVTSHSVSKRSAGLLDGAKKWKVNDFSSKLYLIEQGFGWGRVPRYMCESQLRDGLVKELKLDLQNKKIPHYLCRQRKEFYGPVMQFFWQNI